MAGSVAPAQRRLFVGTFLSPATQSSLGELARQQQALAAAWKTKVRFVDAAMLHLTWLFLGQVAAEHVEEIKQHLALIASRHQSLALSYDGHEFWPSSRLARYLVLTPSVVPAAVLELAQDTRRGLAEFVQRPEGRAYRPHITIIRLNAGLRNAQESPALFSMGDKLPVEQNISKIELLESRLGSGSDRYSSLAAFQLN